MKGYIFDLDGVLVNTARCHYLAWKKLAAELGFELAAVNHDRLCGISRMASLNIVLEEGGINNLSDQEKIELAERKNRYYLDMIDTIDESEVLPGVLEFIKRIKAKGYLIGLGSASKSGRAVVEKVKLISYFDVIVDGNMVTEPKPDPEVFLTAARLLGLKAGDCVVIEDAAAGVKAAKAGGMKCIGIGENSLLREADIVIPSTEQLGGVTVD